MDYIPCTIKKAVELCMKAQLVPFIVSSPGMGKSSIVKELAEEFGLKLIDCRLSSLEPTDLQGLPWIQNGKASFNPFEIFPLESTPIPKGCEGFLLFLDEFNSASRAVQAAAYRIILDREVGQYKLHPRCFVVAAGNKTTDNAITNHLSTAMLSRIIHLHMDVSFEDWRDNFAIPHRIDERVVAYLSAFPEKLMQFDPEKEDETFACPRTWEFVSKLLKANKGKIDSDILPVLAGAVTLEHASAFIQFCNVYKKLITVDQIMKNPDLLPPVDNETLWALTLYLVNKTTEKNFVPIFKFMEKFPTTYQIVYIRSIKKLYGSISTSPEFINFVQHIGTLCYD